jgi:hypothetical protein
MAYGVAWEAVEFVLAGDGRLRGFWEERGINSLWDVWFNFAGYQVGDLWAAARG